MDQEKIGKLIAKLRKNKGLTQRELGEMVGVGFRAVSKWETGLTSPDISIINDLSKILGISADELLKGEVNEKETTPKSKPKKRIIIPITILAIVIIMFMVFLIENKTTMYELITYDKEYYIEGELLIKNKDISLKINHIGFEDKEFIKTVVKNYQYEISCKDALIVGYGYIPAHQSLPTPTTIEKLYDRIKVNYTGGAIVTQNDMVKNGLDFKITLLDSDNNIIVKNIKLKLKKK